MNRDALSHILLIGSILFLFILDTTLGHLEQVAPVNLQGLRNFTGVLAMILTIIEGWRIWKLVLKPEDIDQLLLRWRILFSLQRQLRDAGFGIERFWFLELPKVKLSFSEDLLTGILKVQNSVKFSKRLDDIDFSSALLNYKIERHFISRDANWYIYELLRADVSFRLTFSSLTSFMLTTDHLDPYELFLDARSICRLQHTLLVGQTGSGKTYALYSLILQMLCMSVPYELYFVDPKGSSISVLSRQIAPDRTAVSFDEIVALLEDFVEAMDARKVAFADQLNTRLDADYRYFELEPHVLIIDEYAAFSAVVATKEKKVRDHVESLMHQIILMGRQLGFFVILVMQKSDAKLITTALRDNIPLKIVLGNAEDTTYETTFGTGVDIPPMDYPPGDGVFTEPSLARTPKLVQFPTLDFDILNAAKEVAAWVL